MGSEQSPFDKSSLMYNFGKEAGLRFTSRGRHNKCAMEREMAIIVA